MSAVVKDLLRKDIRNLSNVAVIATCRSRSSLHPVLVSSRGTHLVQEVINIDPPDQVSDSTELTHRHNAWNDPLKNEWPMLYVKFHCGIVVSHDTQLIQLSDKTKLHCDFTFILAFCQNKHHF